MTQILYSNLTDQITSEVLTGEFLLALADRSALPNHPALFQLPDINGGGSQVLKTPQVGLMGFDKMVSTGEASTVSTQALTDASATVTVSRYSKRYEASDLARLQRAPGVGRKTAERILLELKGRLVAATPGRGDRRGDAVSALVNLGYSQRDALRRDQPEE